MYDTQPSMNSKRNSVTETDTAARILVVEDETDLREMLAEALEQAGYRVMQSGTIREARQSLEQQLPDLVLLDWMLPDTSGINWLRQLRRNEPTRDLPVILLTARGEVSDRVTGLDTGADDYIVKPFSLKELQARVRARLRPQQADTEQQQFVAGNLVLDVITHRVTSAGEPVLLGPTEFRLLRHFMSHPDRVYSRSQLLDAVWGQQVFIEERTVDVHVRRLRMVLEPTGNDALIQTVRGVGYRFSTRAA